MSRPGQKNAPVEQQLGGGEDQNPTCKERNQIMSTVHASTFEDRSRRRRRAAGSIRYWTVRELNGPLNSTLVREILRVSPSRARDLWFGRADYDDGELETLAAAVGHPREALQDHKAYLWGSAAPSTWPVDAGQCIATLRAKTGLTRKVAAKRADISKRFLRRLERCEVAASPALLGHVASVLADALVEKALRA